jgi:hypothetical protein
MPNQTTKSERAFEDYCRLRGFGCRQLPLPPSGKCAGYEVTAGGVLMTCEVSELRPNERDEEFMAALGENSIAGMYEQIGRRLRNKIRMELPQLKVYRDRNMPCIVVLFDNVFVQGSHGGNYFSDDDFDAAMYGLPKAATPLATRIDGHAGGRLFTRERRTYASGVAFLNDAKPPMVTLYHNFFASVPLPTGILVRAGRSRPLQNSEPLLRPVGLAECISGGACEGLTSQFSGTNSKKPPPQRREA